MALAYGPFVNLNDGLEILGGSYGQIAHRTSWKLEVFENPMGKDWYRRQPVPAWPCCADKDSVFLFGGCPDIVDLTKCSDAIWRRVGDAAMAAGFRRCRMVQWRYPPLRSTESAIYIFGGCSMP